VSGRGAMAGRKEGRKRKEAKLHHFPEEKRGGFPFVDIGGRMVFTLKFRGERRGRGWGGPPFLCHEKRKGGRFILQSIAGKKGRKGNRQAPFLNSSITSLRGEFIVSPWKRGGKGTYIVFFGGEREGKACFRLRA